MTRKTVRVGIVGAGAWGRMHAEAYRQHPAVDLVGICDLDGDRARDFAADFALAHASNDLDALLDQRLDGLSVTTPDDAHTAVACQAAGRGVHLLVEKPLATTVEECEAILAAADHAGVRLMVDWHNRWNPPVYKAWKAIREGELGEIRYVYTRLSDAIHVPTDMLPWAGRSSVLWFLGSHSLDTVCWLVGETPVRVTCRKQEGVLQGMGVDTADMYLTLVDFANGATALVENSWILPNSAPALIDHRCDITGTEGLIQLDLAQHGAYRKYTQATRRGIPEAICPDVFVLPRIQGRPSGFALASVAHFVDCLASGAPPATTGHDGLLATRLICAAETSAAQDRPVEL